MGTNDEIFRGMIRIRSIREITVEDGCVIVAGGGRGGEELGRGKRGKKGGRGRGCL